MGLMNWLMKGIGFEDETDQETETIKAERKIQKQKIKEAKRKEQEAKRLERANKKLAKYNSQKENDDQVKTRTFAQNPDQFNMSSSASISDVDNYGGYGADYTPVSNNMGGYGSKNVVFFYPKSYEDVQKLIDYLKQGESVMLNLDNISDAEAQRMLDFASGSIYALNGSIQRVSGNIFLLTPEGLNIMVPNQR